jgi:hypothetical protein
MRPIGPRLDATAARSPEAMHAAVEIDAPTYAHEIPTTAELVAPLASPSQNGRRNLGCGWWPIGSDADRDCAAGGRRF